MRVSGERRSWAREFGHQPQLLDQLLDPFEHGVDRPREDREFVAFRLGIEPVAEIAAARSRRHLSDCAGAPLGHLAARSTRRRARAGTASSSAASKASSKAARICSRSSIVVPSRSRSPLGRPMVRMANSSALASALPDRAGIRPSPPAVRSTGGQPARLPASLCPWLSTRSTTPPRIAPVRITSSIDRASAVRPPLRISEQHVAFAVVDAVADALFVQACPPGDRRTAGPGALMTRLKASADERHADRRGQPEPQLRQSAQTLSLNM